MKALYGTDLFGASAAPDPSGPVAQRFTFPPFSVLDARSQQWQERKRAWIACGIRGEIGRSGVHSYGASCVITRHGCGWSGSKVMNGRMPVPEKDQTESSVFDPVLCELAYRWWCPDAGLVLDPFAGGSVRGIVAGMLGREYCGIDLRTEQVAANNVQADAICPEVRPDWICGFA